MAGFDELRERLRDVARRGATWREGYERAFERLRRERCGRWRKPSRAVREELAELARREAGQDYLREFAAFLDELCDAYLAEALPQNRARLRADVGADPDVNDAVWTYAAENVEWVRGPGDGVRLERALAALSLDDLRTDVLAVDELLARLWIRAARAGLEPRAAFQRVAALSNPSSGGGGACFAQQLASFDTSLAFKRAVEPELRRRSA